MENDAAVNSQASIRDLTTHINAGIITQIYVENFVTYGKALIKPGRNLNLIIGPNGTGKSTIVCAIVLGLGGKPSVIGRADTIAEYVRTNCQEAKIETTLEGHNGPIVITRKFNINGHSTWMIDGEVVLLKDITNIMKKFDIQVDNLCQFLPQDKVQEFSALTPSKLLEATERSVGDPMLVVNHKDLKDFRAKHIVIEKFVVDKEKTLVAQQAKYDSLKEMAGHIKERKRLKNKIVHLRQKKAWMYYDEKRKELMQKKKIRDESLAKMKKCKQAAEPARVAIAKLEKEVQVLKQTSTASVREITAICNKLNKTRERCGNFDEEIREIDDEWKHSIQEEKERDELIFAAEQQKNKLDNDLQKLHDDFGDDTMLKKKADQTSRRIDQQWQQIDTSKKMAMESQRDLDFVKNEMKNQERDLQDIQNVESKRLDMLRQRYPDVHRAVMWLRENRDKFDGIIHEPMMLSINVKNPQHAKFLESFLPNRDLIAFVCEDKNTMNQLLRYLRDKQKFEVNVLYQDPDRDVDMNPYIPIEEIRQYGFENYLISLMDAPMTIMKYLATMTGFQNVPIGNSSVDEKAALVPGDINRFFSPNNFYNVSKSRYTGEKSTKMVPISSNRLLSTTIDESKINQMSERLKKLAEKRESIIDEIKNLNTSVETQRSEYSKMKDERQQYQNSLDQMKSLKQKIQLAERKVNSLKEGKASEEEINSRFQKQIQNKIEKQLSMYAQCNVLLESCFQNQTSSEESRLKLQISQQKLHKKRDDFSELNAELKEAEERFNSLDEEMHPLAQSAQRLYTEAVEETGGISPKDPGFKKIDAIFAKLPPTMDEVVDEMQKLESRVRCIVNSGDDTILKDFEETQRIVEELKKTLQEKKAEKADLERKMKNLKEEWITPLQELVNRIDHNFGDYFSQMQCTGEVSLVQSESEWDFDNYGLKIMVKFRDCDDLQELTRNHQSGGERAVTTALYMMALQELTRVPFRCVDEINQGMDATNERRVFELLVKITARPDSSQYFLLTPKLIPKLTYGEGMTVHCVYNGVFMTSYEKFDMVKYCKNVNRIVDKDNEEED